MADATLAITSVRSDKRRPSSREPVCEDITGQASEVVSDLWRDRRGRGGTVDRVSEDLREADVAVVALVIDCFRRTFGHRAAQPDR